ncbi:hypothetical protein, partial [Roseovarius nanhaiticus]|uniref:hypothetical protein n=1 Tax=Roseovarius nanhaiticus TaxID=573024 RepID=UPI002493BFF8
MLQGGVGSLAEGNRRTPIRKREHHVLREKKSASSHSVFVVCTSLTAPAGRSAVAPHSVRRVRWEKIWKTGSYRRLITSVFDETTNLQFMDINHIYEALTSSPPPEHLLPAGSPFASASALALLVQIEGVDLSRFSAAPSARLSHLPLESDRAFP